MKLALRKLIYLYIFLFFGIASLVFYFLGLFFVNTYNLRQNEHFTSFTPALPSKVLDIRGDLITEFSMDEKREIVAFENISANLINALIAREDSSFFENSNKEIELFLFYLYVIPNRRVILFFIHLQALRLST